VRQQDLISTNIIPDKELNIPMERLSMSSITHTRVTNFWKLSIFSAQHGMPARTSDEKSACPSVCLSVCQKRGLWQNGRKICPDFLYHANDHL